MASLQDYVYLSEVTYNVGRNKKNELSEKDLNNGWTQIIDKQHGDLDPNFSAMVFQKGDEIVIAFTGTNNNIEYVNASAPAGVGLPANQIKDALDLTMRVLKDHPNAKITFTGHSLGGGIASIMATFFGRDATIFDAAPFENSVTNPASVFYYANYVREGWGKLPAEFEQYCNSSAIGDAWKNLGYSITDKMAFGVILAETYINYEKGILGQEFDSNFQTIIKIAQRDLNIVIPNTALRNKETFLKFMEATDYYNLFKAAGHFGSFNQRESTITNHFISGEILEWLREAVPVIGQDKVLDIGKQVSLAGESSIVEVFHDRNISLTEAIKGAVNLDLTNLDAIKSLFAVYKIYGSYDISATMHLIPLTQAAIWSENFKQALQKQKYAVATFFDSTLYGYDYNKTTPNEKANTHFLIKMVKDHVINNNGQLDKLAADLTKLLDADSSDDDRVVKGLLAALTEYWYFNADASKTAFNALEGGVQLDSSKYAINADSRGRDRLKQMLIDDIHYSLLSFEIARKGLSKEALRSIGTLLGPFDLSKVGLYNISHYQRDLSVDSSANSQNTLVWAYNASSVYAKTGAGDDTLIGSADGRNTLYGEGGNDLIISFGNGRNVLNGGDGQDTIYAYGTNAEINGGAGNDTIYSYADNAIIDGGDDNDYIEVYGKNAKISGGKGNDTLKGSKENADIFEGGEGIDTYYTDKGDVIKDSDGEGKVFYKDKLLTSAFLMEGETHKFRDIDLNTYELQGTTLVVNGELRIENFIDEGVNIEDLGLYYSRLGITLYLPKKPEKIKPQNIQRQEIIGEDNPDSDHADSLYGEDAGVNYHIQGKLGDDYLEGNDGKDSLEGGEGDDTLVGNAGDDILDGGEGEDYLKGGAGNDILIGGEGSNRLYGGAGDDWLFATKQEEVDSNWGSQASGGSKQMGSVLCGGDGEDTLVGSDSVDVIFGGIGNKLIYAGKGDDFILLNQTSGSAQSGWAVYLDTNGYQYWVKRNEYDQDLISRYFLAADTKVVNTVYAGAGNDLIEGSEAGQDIIYAGIGDDTIFNGRGNGLIFAEDGDDFIFGDSYKYIFNETAHGYDYRWISEDKDGKGYGNDTLDGGDGKDTIIGAGGDDVIYGGKGDDSLFGDHQTEPNLTAEHYGNDYLDGGEGNDIIYGGGGHDTILGGAGNDTILADDVKSDITIQGNDYVDGGEGDDSIYGEAGNDTLIGNIGNDTLCGGLGDDALYGGEGDDYMLGDDNNDQSKHGNDYMDGGAGKDSLWGMGGDDTLLGGDDDDYLDGGEGNNYLYGGTGNDTINAVGSADEDKHGNNYLDGGEGKDILISGSGSDTLIGGAGADQLVQFKPSTNSANDNDYLDGGDGNDTLSALTGNNTLIGGKGNDVLVSDLAAFDGFKDIGVIANDYLDGGEGNDFLISAGGADTLVGGTGSDTYSIFLKEGNTVILREEGTDIDYVTLAGSNISYEDPNTKISISASSMIIETPKGKVILANYNQFEYITFTEGTILVTDIVADLNIKNTNHAPIAQGKLDAQQVESGSQWQWSLPANSFVDIDPNDTLTYKVTLQDGSPLPDWLSYDPQTGSLKGNVPNNATSGQYNILITAYDRVGASASHSFTLNIAQAIEKITGTARNDKLTGDARDNYLMGLAGNDQITANAGNDTLDGGIGNDTLNGGLGADIYLFAKGDGQDTINTGDTNQAIDTISFTNITAQDIRNISRVGNNLVIEYGDTDKVTITNHFTTLPIGYITFADGQTSSFQDFLNNQWGGLVLTDKNDSFTVNNGQDQLIKAGLGNDRITTGAGNDTLYGEAGNDNLTGGAGDDILIGGLGNDSLNGGTGNDTYLFGRGDGQDTINNSSATWQSDNDRLLFQEGINADQLWFQKKGNNLIVSVIGTTDKITVTNWYKAEQYKLDSFELANGESLLANQVDNLVNAMASFNPPASGQTELPDNYHNKLDTLIAAGWN